MKLSKQNKTQRRFSCVSLFSGCGGLDLGLRDAGFDIKVAVDSDKDCLRTHKFNFPETRVIERDILTWTKEEMLSDLRPEGRDIDLLAAGPPCPPFSKSRFWRTDLPRGFADPKGLDSFGAFIRALEATNPRTFILENVRGLTYRGHRDALQYVLDEAKRLGFQTSWRILNAVEYGAPQLRERCFIIGWQEGDFEFPAPTHRRPNAQEEGNNLLPFVTAGDVLRDIDTEALADPWGHTAGGRFKHLLEEIPPGENYLYLTAERGHPNPQFKYRSRYWTYLLKLSPDLPSWTIQAKRTNNMGPLHWRNRVLRIPEIKRLQTFPDEFELFGDVNKKWRQIGNAVPPALARAVGSAVSCTLAASAKCLTKAA